MRGVTRGVGSVLVVLALSFGANCWAATPVSDPVAKALEKTAVGQQVLKLPVRVVDPQGKPVAKAKVIPWALRSSQGHGWWQKDDKQAKVGPEDAFTNAHGIATVLYPKFADVQEQIRTIQVSVFVDHPEFAFTEAVHIDVPPEKNMPYEIKLNPGVPLEIRPLIDGKSADLTKLYAEWSDGRSWQKGAAPERTTNGTLRIPAMPPGTNTLLLVKLEGERASYFSKITSVELKAGERPKIDVALRPSLRIQGRVSDNVPRPVKNGRIKTETLRPTRGDHNRVEWFSWFPINADGTFTIDGWPAGEPIQLIALCDGYVAKYGTAPKVAVQPANPAPKADSDAFDPFGYPQVFEPAEGQAIEVQMIPLVQCVVKTMDEDDKPVAGVTVVSWPNVQWWNDGSQIYCTPLVRGERLIREREYQRCVDEPYSEPFTAKSDGQGKATLDLPPGNHRLAINSDVYELPAILGRRDANVELVSGRATATILWLQPRGTEKLGEWDKLAGVVFGCSTREGRRICALPGVQKQMDDFAKQFREAKSQRDPQLLAEAYAVVADAFKNVGDQEESIKWQRKSADELAKLNGLEQSANPVRPASGAKQAEGTGRAD